VHIPLLLYIFLLAWLARPDAPATSESDFASPTSRSIINGGEEFVYEVRWTVFKLGTVRLRTLPRFAAEARIDSYPSVPFVDLHSTHYSEMDSAFFSLASHTAQKKETDWWGLNYIYDLPRKRLIVEETHQKDPSQPPFLRTVKDTLHLPGTTFLDGLSVAYYARLNIHSEKSVEVPTVLYGKVGTTTFHFTNNRTTEEIDALEEPVRVVEVEGTTTAVGVYGMTGDFTGWFSDDEAAVPIKGKLQVLIGNVTLELVKWNRKGWNPPQ